MAEDESAIFDRFSMALELGVRMAMGSDCGGNEARQHGNNVDELIAYVRFGMSPMDAISSGTLQAARAVWLDDEVGSLEPGKAADLVVVDGDPLSEIELLVSGVAGVVQEGRVVRDDLGSLTRCARASVRGHARAQRSFRATRGARAWAVDCRGRGSSPEPCSEP